MERDVFTVTEEGRKQKTFTCKKLEKENFDLFFIDNDSRDHQKKMDSVLIYVAALRNLKCFALDLVLAAVLLVKCWELFLKFNTNICTALPQQIVKLISTPMQNKLLIQRLSLICILFYLENGNHCLIALTANYV